MSEKRFAIEINEYDGYNCYDIIDTKTKKEYSFLDDEFSNGKEVVDLFNQLSEENEQLRKDKAQLKERLRECRIRLDKFNCR